MLARRRAFDCRAACCHTIAELYDATSDVILVGRFTIVLCILPKKSCMHSTRRDRRTRCCEADIRKKCSLRMQNCTVLVEEPLILRGRHVVWCLFCMCSDTIQKQIQDQSVWPLKSIRDSMVLTRCDFFTLKSISGAQQSTQLPVGDFIEWLTDHFKSLSPACIPCTGCVSLRAG